MKSLTITEEMLSVIKTVRTERYLGKIFMAICDYALYGVEPNLTGRLWTIFQSIRLDIDKSQSRRIAQSIGVKNRLQKVYKKFTNDLQNVYKNNDSLLKNGADLDKTCTSFVQDLDTVCTSQEETMNLFGDSAKNEIEQENESSPLASPYKEKEQDKDKNTPPSPLQGESTSVPAVGVIDDREMKSCFPFDAFWNMYGKKVDKKKCQVAYARIGERTRSAIKAALPLYVAVTPDVQFRKNPLTYLHGACWQDDVYMTDRKRIATTDEDAARGDNDDII